MVRQVEVLRSIVEETGRVATVVILEIHGVCPVCLRQDDAIFCCKVGGNSVDGFACSNAAFIVSVRVDVSRSILIFRIYGDFRKLSAIRPLELHIAVGQDVPVSIIGQARAVDRGQLILPGGIAIAEVRSFRRKVRDSRERISCL